MSWESLFFEATHRGQYFVMGHNLQHPKQLRRISYGFSTTTQPTALDSSQEWNSPVMARPLSARSDTHGPALAFFNKPPPKAASEPPITIVDATRKVNHHILRACALLAHDELDEALAEADFALYVAQARKIYHMQSKSQLYRGLCLMELQRWEEASAAFTRAANVRGWAVRIAELKIEAERKVNQAEEWRKRKETQVGEL